MKARTNKCQRGDTRILFLNQVAGPLFRELAADVAVSLGRSILLTGQGSVAAREAGPALEIVGAPEYDRRNLGRRVFSWLAYFAIALRITFTVPPGTLLFIVSNPPFLPLAGWLAKKLRGQCYVVLVYDVYPGLLESLGTLKRNGVAARLWRRFNRLTWGQAERIFTIGNYMAANIRGMLAPDAVSCPVEVIANWADVEFIKPLPKHQNWFARKHSRAGRLTVLYSGNLGNTHDIESIVEAAIALRDDPTLEFLIIGAGPKWYMVERAIQTQGLTNVTLLPFQLEKELPFTLTTGDVALITLESGIEGLSVPSKTFYAMAAGAALISLTHGPNEVTEIIEKFGCGLAVEPGDVAGLKAAIQRFQQDGAFLRGCRLRACQAAEQHFSRENTRLYVEAPRTYCPQV